MISLDVIFNGAAIECSGENPIYNWVWTNEEGVEKVTFSWTNTNYARYIHSIDVVYTPDLGGKLENGLSFSEKSFEAVLGESFSSPILTNPNNLNISWTSSDESVATVDAEGKVTLVDKGTTVITATTEGNDEYAAGNAKYELSVIPSASNIAELKAMAPNQYDRVKVNFPAVVNYGNLSFAYVTDAEGNATCFDDMRNRNSSSTSVVTLYKAGQVIPAGWIATNATMFGSAIWEGFPEKSTETVEVTYPVVTSITPEDADRVVVLENVKFEGRTPEGTTKAFGTTPDGTSYEFQDTYNIGSKRAGTYDVTGVVRYSKRGDSEFFYIAPIKYTEAAGSFVEIEESDAIKATYYNLDGTPVAEPKSGVFIKVENGKSLKIVK
ncbi:MAG: Ig-like domain-containing protein [Muribaculaceae bacterium]|nr:Ig-like domain-containing protein [Muribaculaceae bacterium]